jgi:CDGSH iron-sulfur domain-containing protein 3
MADTTIKVSDNGPYLVQGSFSLTDPDGNVFETRETIALCRCGRSEKKPFCDGTHNKVGFSSVCRRQQ